MRSIPKGNIFQYLFFFCLVIISSCSNFENTNPKPYLEYASVLENGLIKATSYNDIDITLKLIPTQYFLLKDNDLNKLDRTAITTLQDDYLHSLYFMLDIAPKRTTNKVIDRNTYSIEEFKRKTQGLNFNLEQLFTLDINDSKMYPVLSSLQNVYELDGRKSILLAFQIDEYIDKDFTCTLNDQIFTGETFTFNFLKSDFDKIPQLSI